MELNLDNIVLQAGKIEEIRKKLQLKYVATDSEVMNYWTNHPFMHVAVVVTDKTEPKKLLFDSKGRPTIDNKIFKIWYQQQLSAAERLEGPQPGDLRKEILGWPEKKRRKSFENIKHYVVGVFDTKTEFAVSTRTNEIAQKIKVDSPAQLRFVLGNILRVLGGRLIGYNIEGYDAIRYSNLRRDEDLLKRIGDDKVRELCSKPDGLFGVTPGWSSAYYSGQTWKESFRIAGLELYDCLQVAQNYFGFLTVDRTLVTFSHMVNFFRKLGFDFTKVMQTYKAMQVYAEKARDGDWRAAYESERYGFEDTEEHHEGGLQTIPIFDIVGHYLNMPTEFVFRAPKLQVASRFWNMINVNQEGLPQHKLDTKDYELFDLKSFKEKMINQYLGYKSTPWHWGRHDQTVMFHLPFLIPTLRPLIRKFEQLEGLTREFYNSEDILERLVFAQVLERVLTHPIVDFQRVEKGELNSNIFEFRYQTAADDFGKMLLKKSIGMTEQRLDSSLFKGEISLEEYLSKANLMIPLLETLAGNFHGLTGHFLFADKKAAEKVVNDKSAIEISSGIINLEDLVKEEKMIFISSGKLIIPNKGQHLFDFGGYITSEGIGMPSYKKRFTDEYDKKEEPMFLTKLKFDFIHGSFESKEKALEILWDYGQKVRKGGLPVENFYITITPKTDPKVYAGSYRVHRRYYRIKHLNLKLDQPQTCLLVEEKGQEIFIPKEKYCPSEHQLAIDAYLAEAFEEGKFMDLNIDAVFFSGLHREIFLQAKREVKRWYNKDGLPFPTDQAKGQRLLFGPLPGDNFKSMIYLLDRIKFGYAAEEEKKEFKDYLTQSL